MRTQKDLRSLDRYIDVAATAARNVVAGLPANCELGPVDFTSELERAFRDIQGAHFHPLPERRQHIFSGLVELGLDPASA